MTDLIQEQQERSKEIDQNQIFLEVVAGKRTDRVYGLGAMGVEYCKTKKYGFTGDTFGAYTAKLENEIKDLKQVVTNVTQELKEAKQQMVQTQLQMEERVQ